MDPVEESDQGGGNMDAAAGWIWTSNGESRRSIHWSTRIFRG